MEKVIFLGKKKNNYKKIFVDLPHGLGDQIMCLPLFKSLKHKFPDAEITVFTPNSSSASLLELFPYVDDYKTIDIQFSYLGIIGFLLQHYLSLRSFIKRNQFDLYLAPHYNPVRGLFARIFPFPAAVLNKEHTHKVRGVGNVLGYLGAEVDYDYSVSPVSDPAALRKFRLAYNDYIVLDIYPQHLDDDPRGWCCFDELISRLKTEGYNVVLVGLNKDHSEKDGVVDLVNKTTFHELLAVLEGAAGVIALDSGIFHFSYCLGTPVVGLFGPVAPESRLPVNVGNVEYIYKNVECSPCIVNKVDIPCSNADFLYECMKTIRAEDVMRKIREVLKNDK